MKRNMMVFLAACAVLLAAASPCLAASYGLLSGGEIDTEENAYAYVGLIADWPVGKNLSVTGKVWGSYLTYEFDKDAETIQAEAPSVQLSLGLRRAWPQNFTGTLWLGWEYRNTDIDPFRQDVTVRGVMHSLVVQAELDKWTRKMLNWSLILSYSTETEYLWGRARLKKELASRPLGGGYPLRVGVEVIGQGNDDYQAGQVGPVLEVWSDAHHFSFLLKGGFKTSSAVDASAYGGVEFYLGL